jgi:dihydrodipicolinate synthase/N-acetylneuraminate lyase
MKTAWLDYRGTDAVSRRLFLQISAVLTAAAATPPAAGKPLRGIFPIAQTPFTAENKLDLEVLVAQLHFLDRCGVHGVVWPQLASEWDTLSETERMAGMEALASEGKKLRPAIVLGVQAADAAAAIRYARHAEKVGADAVIALPPPGDFDHKALIYYYKGIGAATPLPLFAQAVGKLTVDQVVEFSRAVPTLKHVKDEAGEPLLRIGPLVEKSAGALSVFTGGHGRTMLDEMSRGSSGSMPAASFADLYVAAWDLWQAGKRKEAMEVFSKTSMLINEVQAYGIESLKYILLLRGVFKTWHVRKGGGKLDAAGRKMLTEMLEFARPHLRV